MSQAADVVILQPKLWHVTPAAEVLREFVKEELPRRYGRVFDILLMAGSKADYLENKVKNLVLGAVAYTAPTPVYFGLWGTAGSLTDTFAGNTANEISGGAYARVGMTNNTTNFPTVSGTTAKTNGVAITWSQASANWNSSANINQVGVLDGNAGTAADNGLLWADLTTPKPVLSGDTAQFAANDFSWSED